MWFRSKLWDNLQAVCLAAFIYKQVLNHVIGYGKYSSISLFPHRKRSKAIMTPASFTQLRQSCSSFFNSMAVSLWSASRSESWASAWHCKEIDDDMRNLSEPWEIFSFMKKKLSTFNKLHLLFGPISLINMKITFITFEIWLQAM